jgi:hypothetical protein
MVNVDKVVVNVWLEMSLESATKIGQVPGVYFWAGLFGVIYGAMMQSPACG